MLQFRATKRNGFADRFAGDDDFGPMSDGAAGSDFLSRERAALGDDADQFSTPNDNIPSVTVQDGAVDDDLLGGGDHVNGVSEDINKFQSSFPAVDTRNEVLWHTEHRTFIFFTAANLSLFSVLHLEAQLQAVDLH